MIRYVLAVALAVALLGASVPAIDHAATTNAERTVETAVATIEEEAKALVEEEDLSPRGVRGAQRTLELTFPEDSLLSKDLAYLRIRRPMQNHSVVEYRVRGGSKRVVHVEVPIVNVNRNAVELRSIGGEHEVYLVLMRASDSDRPVVMLATDRCMNAADPTERCDI